MAGLPQRQLASIPGAIRRKQIVIRSIARAIADWELSRATASLLAEPGRKILRNDPPRFAPHFVDAIVTRNPGLRGTVKTTLDLDVQATGRTFGPLALSALKPFTTSRSRCCCGRNATAQFRAHVDRKLCCVAD